MKRKNKGAKKEQNGKTKFSTQSLGHWKNKARKKTRSLGL